MSGILFSHANECSCNSLLTSDRFSSCYCQQLIGVLGWRRYRGLTQEWCACSLLLLLHCPCFFTVWVFGKHLVHTVTMAEEHIRASLILGSIILVSSCLSWSPPICQLMVALSWFVYMCCLSYCSYRLVYVCKMSSMPTFFSLMTSLGLCTMTKRQFFFSYCTCTHTPIYIYTY